MDTDQELEPEEEGLLATEDGVVWVHHHRNPLTVLLGQSKVSNDNR